MSLPIATARPLTASLIPQQITMALAGGCGFTPDLTEGGQVRELLNRPLGPDIHLLATMKDPRLYPRTPADM